MLSSSAVREKQDIIRKGQIARKLKTNPPDFERGRRSSCSTLRSQSPVTNDEGNEDVNEDWPQKSSLDVESSMPKIKNYASEVIIVSHVDRTVSRNDKRSRKLRTEQQNEARRKKDGQKVRENHRQRLLREAEEGGYSIGENEMNKRLDAYMRKREVLCFVIWMTCPANPIDRKNFKRKKPCKLFIKILSRVTQKEILS
jgi:hypothetical protein